MVVVIVVDVVVIAFIIGVDEVTRKKTMIKIILTCIPCCVLPNLSRNGDKVIRIMIKLTHFHLFIDMVISFGLRL